MSSARLHLIGTSEQGAVVVFSIERAQVATSKTLVRWVNLWRQETRARGVVIRRHIDKPRGRRLHIFKDHWEEMARCLEERPDQTALDSPRVPGPLPPTDNKPCSGSFARSAAQRAIWRFRFHTSGERVTFLVKQPVQNYVR